MSDLTANSFARTARAGLLLLSALAFGACAENEDTDAPDSGVVPVLPGDASTPDSGFQQPDTGVLPPFDAGAPDAGKPDASLPDASTPDAGKPDASTPDAGPTDSGMSIPDAFVPPPPAEPGTWTLNPDSAEPCPEEPPPIPIIGGLCAGIYFGCGWTNSNGAKYSCVCDWVHWLCI